MPKLKTHKGAAARLKLTGSGKLVRLKIGVTHFRRRKAARTKRAFGEFVPVSPSDVKRLKKLIPNA
jgi:large subunit ribosomal protein L35